MTTVHSGVMIVSMKFLSQLWFVESCSVAFIPNVPPSPPLPLHIHLALDIEKGREGEGGKGEKDRLC